MPNRLSVATSPYLLQHRDNPVDWYEWGPEALAAAKLTDRPILLSVGYSACHWCHVMAHESFEDPETAALMNSRFVNVKVDREERPDVDAIYMDAVQALTGHGGWPMTVFLTPSGRPFYAGTYFPKEDRHGMPSFRRVLQAVSDAWLHRRHDVEQQAGELTQVISRQIEPAAVLPAAGLLEGAYGALEKAFDPVFGGFGGAPKFPQAPTLDFLLRIASERWAPEAGPMVQTTLERMARGGIYDHLGGGFARYSVDERWLIPHFEKMLYDNAQLARLYLRAWQVLGEERFRTVAVETLDYLLRDLLHPEGGFFSAEDADSEGEEGRFYVWSRDEFFDVVGSDAETAARYFGITAEGNFEGSNHLHQAQSVEDVAEALGEDAGTVSLAIESASRALFARRSERVRPGLDDKVVTAWNGLALRALAEAGAVLGEGRYLEAARHNARFVLANLRRHDGRLMRSWREGRTSVPGFCEDYAAYAVGLFCLYQATGETEWYREAMALVEGLVGLFSDPGGGFYTTGSDADRLVTRPKELMDNPAPSGNSLAAEALLIAGLYEGEERYRELTEGAIRAAGRIAEGYPSGAGHLLGVLRTLTSRPKEVAIVGSNPDRLVRVVWETYRPDLVLALDRDGRGAADVPLLEGRHMPEATLAYVCEGFACLKPVETPEELRALL